MSDETIDMLIFAYISGTMLSFVRWMVRMEERPGDAYDALLDALVEVGLWPLFVSKSLIIRAIVKWRVTR